MSDVSGLDTSLTELEDVETKSDNSAPKLMTPNAFVTTIPKPVKPVSQAGQDTPLNQPEPVSVTSSITSVTSLNNSLSTVNIEQPLEKSQTAESECSFKTCDNVTLSEQPSGFHSWLGRTYSPSLPLPESPDPAKVPFPAFETERRGVNQLLEDDNILGLTHSTPLRRRSPDQDIDSDKTPTAEDEILSKEKDILSSSPPRPSFPEEQTSDFSPPDEKPESPKLAFAGSGGQSEFGFPGSERLPEVVRVKEGDALTPFQTPVTGQLGQANEETETQSDQRWSQRSQRNTKYVYVIYCTCCVQYY